MIALLQISWRMWQLKNFENRPVFDEVMCRLRRLSFFGPPCSQGVPNIFRAPTYMAHCAVAQLSHEVPRWLYISKTRSAWQSQTWDRPAQQVGVDCQFMYSKFLSQLRHQPNDPENRTLKSRGKWNCVSLQCTSTSGVSIFAPIHFRLWAKVHYFAWKTLVRISPLSPKLSRFSRWILRQILNFRDWNFVGGPPSPLEDGLGSVSQSVTRVKIWGDSTAYGRNIDSRKNLLGLVNMSHHNFFCLWTKDNQIFFSQRGRGSGWSSFFQMFDMSFRFGDIRDQSPKPWQIAPKFRRFLALPNFRGRAFQKL